MVFMQKLRMQLGGNSGFGGDGMRRGFDIDLGKQGVPPGLEIPGRQPAKRAAAKESSGDPEIILAGTVQRVRAHFALDMRACM